MQYEIIGNGGNNMYHHFPIGDVVTLIQTDGTDTALYASNTDADYIQWVGDNDVQEVV